MTITRNKLYRPTEYLGRPTSCRDEECPCRSCWSPHDFGGINSQGKHIVQMMCLSREWGGCPQPIPAAEHRKGARVIYCKRCGVIVPEPG